MNTYKHIKTGNIYVLLHHAVDEHSLIPCIVYQRVVDSSIWVRPSAEFFDGRFVHLDAVRKLERQQQGDDQ